MATGGICTLNDSELKVLKGTNGKEYGFFYTKVSPFSQFYNAEFEAPGEDMYGANKFTCAEMYMMYCKARLFKDDAIAEKILKERAPPRIKALGRKVKNFDDKIWKNHCFDFVVQGNYYKFSQNNTLKDYIISTKNIHLAEASPSDRIWGIGMKITDPNIADERNWKGRNLLGKALMEVRKRILTQDSSTSGSDELSIVTDDESGGENVYI
ncbi:unnamed protein product [Dimorphilus gyrociliatus]|uniref:NADAR domain-containing protein n=1 Tax=Dimorphilus gyrociliatus TaxID=2664684 RepID=A0A7I8VP42_9ANNE|nr:unnamed protein product [Dimorphilus gyrociliatus]